MGHPTCFLEVDYLLKLIYQLQILLAIALITFADPTEGCQCGGSTCTCKFGNGFRSRIAIVPGTTCNCGTCCSCKSGPTIYGKKFVNQKHDRIEKVFLFVFKT